jgi:small subunit ribosomal protein S21
VQVLVRDNNVDQALRALKKKMQREGIFREMKLRRNYEKPSEKRAREKAEAVRRTRKLLRKRMEREATDRPPVRTRLKTADHRFRPHGTAPEHSGGGFCACFPFRHAKT